MGMQKVIVMHVWKDTVPGHMSTGQMSTGRMSTGQMSTGHMSTSFLVQGHLSTRTFEYTILSTK